VRFPPSSIRYNQVAPSRYLFCELWGKICGRIYLTEEDLLLTHEDRSEAIQEALIQTNRIYEQTGYKGPSSSRKLEYQFGQAFGSSAQGVIYAWLHDVLGYQRGPYQDYFILLKYDKESGLVGFCEVPTYEGDARKPSEVLTSIQNTQMYDGRFYHKFYVSPDAADLFIYVDAELFNDDGIDRLEPFVQRVTEPEKLVIGRSITGGLFWHELMEKLFYLRLPSKNKVRTGFETWEELEKLSLFGLNYSQLNPRIIGGESEVFAWILGVHSRLNCDLPRKRQYYSYFLRDGGLCVYCGKRANSIDHMVPQIKQGPNTRYNLVACCTPCNSRKLARTPAEWGILPWGWLDDLRYSDQLVVADWVWYCRQLASKKYKIDFARSMF
jgi:hypothetical protein